MLAQDFLDGNFSIVANFDNGKIKSIIMNDERDTVEMFNDNTVRFVPKAMFNALNLYYIVLIIKHFEGLRKRSTWRLPRQA